jgi:hypothetical protein
MKMSIFDILGPTVKLTIQRKDYYKSNFGGFSTFIILIVFFLAFFGFGNDLFKRENPTVTFNRINNNELLLYNITDNNFLFSIYDQFTDEPISDFDRRFYVYYDYYSLDGQGSIEVDLNNPMEKCSQETLKKFEDNFYSDPSTYLCFPKNSKIELKGVMSKGINSAIRLQVNYCKNNTDSSKGKLRDNCLLKDDTLKFLAGRRIQMHLIVEDAVIDTYNYKVPGKFIAYTTSINTNTNSWTRMKLIYKKIIFNSNNGFLFNDVESQTYITTESMNLESIYSPDTDTIFSHMIGNSQWLEIYNRSYIKVQDIFAIMGGFINFSLIIIRFIVGYVSRPNIIDIFNENYKYLDVRSDNKNKYETTKNYFNESNNILRINKVKPSGQDLGNIKSNDVMANINDESESTKIIASIRRNEKKKYSVKMNFCVRLFRVCYLSKNKSENYTKIYSRTNKKYNKVVSIENLIKLTRYFKLLCTFKLEDNDRNIMKICSAPKQKKKDFEEQTKLFMKSLKDKNNKISHKIADYMNN